ncbi:hypothetical protein F5Y00DRAFT_260764 [Daldinia vernicosa]|uniref:uncharacterized protein n=1 Tax=Daldinia vernicosa TaxID=114800 RepID=UPI00200896FF|nr:uncharacterized protein F5Y00DRAFT_260764 [Daldinia vernicosa]KAI0850032.1 hypothetical protein F5Y00DRAFT_260764 [Daldinia vernicosa]
MDRRDSQPEPSAVPRPAAGATADSLDILVPTSPALSTLSSIYSPGSTTVAPIEPPSAHGPRQNLCTDDPQFLNAHFHPEIVPRTWSAPCDPYRELPSIFSSLEVYKGENSDNNGLDAAQSAIGHAIVTYKKSLLDELEKEGTIFGLKVQLPPDAGDYGVVREMVESEAFESFDRLQAALAAHEFREYGVPRERRVDFFGPPPPREMRDTGPYENLDYFLTLSMDPRDIHQLDASITRRQPGSYGRSDELTTPSGHQLSLIPPILTSGITRMSHCSS